MSVTPKSCPSADELEAIALGRRPSAELRRHLDACPACRDTLGRISDDNEFLAGFAIDGALPVGRPADAGLAIDVPGYDLTREIHRGGQGVVYLAVQRSTRREVAIKVMKQGPFATLADRARFDREIDTLGRLEHPNIVAVHDAGVAGGHHYFVMNYVDGEPLDEWFAGQRAAGAFSVRRAVEVFIKVCDAVHAAHLRGVMHRDLKPSNIRVDGRGEPHVLDFGLAKPIDAGLDSAMTQTGQFVGSLPWASPEQVEGTPSKIDLRTDVYSLGAILFQALTGARPFDVGSNLRDTLESIMRSEPRRPSELAAAGGDTAVGDELDTIVLKCLSKERERRYQSAGELALDLRRFLAGEPIDAKRDSALYVLGKALRRYRRGVTVAASFVVLLALFGVVMSLLYRRSTRLEHEATESAASLARMLSQSNIEQGRMAGVLGNVQQAELLLWRELLTRRDAGGEARLTTPPGPPEAYWALWELYRRQPCRRTLTPQPFAMRAATVADDGAGLWTADQTGVVQRLDEFGRQTDAYTLPFPVGKSVPWVDARGSIVCRHVGERLTVWRRGSDAPAAQLAAAAMSGGEARRISDGGRRVACLVGGEAIVRDIDSFAVVGRFGGGQTPLSAIGLSNDDRLLAGRNPTGGIFIWDIDSSALVAQVPSAPPSRGDLHSMGELLFSPHDRWLADAWIETSGRIWDLGRQPPTAVELDGRPGEYRVLAFSPDERLLAVADLGGRLGLFDAATGRRISTFVGQAGRAWSIGFTGDGRGVWTAVEGALRLWDARPEADARAARIDGEVFHCVAVSPDDRWWIAAGGMGRLNRYDATSLAVTTRAFGNSATIPCVAISSDGRRIAAASYGSAVYLWDAEAIDQAPRSLAHPHRVSHVVFSPDGSRVVTSCDDQVARVWRLADGAVESELRGSGDRVPQVDIDSSGRRVAAAVRDGSILVWNLDDPGRPETWRPATREPTRAVRFAPDGRWLVAAGADRSVSVWNTAAGRLDATLVGHNQEIYCLDVSRDGALVASGDTGGAIRLWHLGLRRPLATLEGHGGAVMSVRFTSDARALVSASLDGSIRRWDLGYYEQHIAGQVDAQLRQLQFSEADAPTAAAWRGWADGQMRRATPAAH